MVAHTAAQTLTNMLPLMCYGTEFARSRQHGMAQVPGSQKIGDTGAPSPWDWCVANP